MSARTEAYLLLAKRFPSAVAVTTKFIHDSSLALWRIKQVEVVIRLIESSEVVLRREYGNLPSSSQKYAFMRGQADAHRDIAKVLRDRLAGKNWMDILRAGRNR